MTYISEKLKKTRTWLNNANPLGLGMNRLRVKNHLIPPCLILFVFVIAVLYSHYSLKFVNSYFDFVIKCLECE